jgi:hypothetical protein
LGKATLATGVSADTLPALPSLLFLILEGAPMWRRAWWNRTEQMAQETKQDDRQVIARNKRARHDYHILDSWEAGLS